MSALFILIGISILVAGGFLAAFLWSVRSGQFDDDYTPSVRMLFDEKVEDNKQELKGNKQKAINKTQQALSNEQNAIGNRQPATEKRYRQNAIDKKH